MNGNTERDEVPPAERAAWEALPDGASIPSGLEDQTVDMLRAHDVLRGDWRRRWTRVAGLAAAAAGIFALGLGAGVRIGGTSGPPVVENPALRIQRAGTEYVSALAQLEADSPQDAPAGEVALRTFHGAARELTRITGPAALAEQVLAATRPSVDQAGGVPAPTVIWF